MNIDKLEQAQRVVIRRVIELKTVSHEEICLLYPFLCCISTSSSHPCLQLDFQEVQDKHYSSQIHIHYFPSNLCLLPNPRNLGWLILNYIKYALYSDP